MSKEDTQFQKVLELLLRIENRVLTVEERVITLEEKIVKGEG